MPTRASPGRTSRQRCATPPTRLRTRSSCSRPRASEHVRFLADENLDFAVVRSLRAAGHDVRALAEETHRTVDADVIALAASESRILLTEDKDFGWLAFVVG